MLQRQKAALVSQALPATGPTGNTETADSTAPDGPLDAEKAELVAGMLRLVTATLGHGNGSALAARASHHQGSGHNNHKDSDKGSCRSGGDRSSDELQDDDSLTSSSERGGEADADGSEQCPSRDTEHILSDFDALERRAAGRFIQVADAAAAAAYGARWACQPRPAGIASRALSSASAAVRTVAQIIRTAAQALRQQIERNAAPALRAARRTLTFVTALLPAPLRERITALMEAVAVKLQSADSIKDSRADEWWRLDPNRRPSLWTTAGWQRRATDVKSALPSLQTTALTLCRVVPGFADVVLSLQKHQPLCAAHPLDAVDAEAAADRRHW